MAATLNPSTRDLNSAINRFRTTDNHTNLVYLAREYLTLALVAGTAIAFAEQRTTWGLAWGWNVPVFAIAIILIGGIQHRLAGLGHEAAHYILLRNRFWNDLIGDLLCMFPIFATIHFYRLFHHAHHQFTNDPSLDPDLVNLGESKGVRDFPMPKGRFVLGYFFRLFASPRKFVRFQWDYLYLNCFGKGGNIYMRRLAEGDGHDERLRLGSVLGIAYFFGLSALTFALTSLGRGAWLAPAAFGCWLAASGIALALPNWATYASPFKEPYSPRVGSVVRLAYYTAVVTALAQVRWITDGRSVVYPLLLWIVPLGTSFTVYLLLRDIYQHANSDRGRLTNSRVFHVGPFTRWAVFVYGQDIHLTHHLYPAVPHYRLAELHELLKGHDADYARTVVECHGTFSNQGGHPTILDVLSAPITRTPR